MKTILLMTMLLGGGLAARAEELTWLTDAAKAQAQAKSEKKLVLLDFTGSDWCIWCHRLNKDVFGKPEFAEYAKKNLVLVEVDFPRKKKLSAEQAKANEQLKAKYAIPGYPTLILLDGDGKKLARLDFMDGVDKAANKDRNPPVADPTTFIASIEQRRKG